MRISACAVANDCGPVAAVEAGCSAANLSVTPGATSDTVSTKPALDEMCRHRRAHVAEADETDLGNGHRDAPVAACAPSSVASASIAAKTSAALRNASSAAGPPQ